MPGASGSNHATCASSMTSTVPGWNCSPCSPSFNGTRLELFSMLAQAAMHGMGVALIPPFLIRSELESGRLVIANPHSFDSSNAYYLVIPERKAESATLQGFRDWVIEEARAYVQSRTGS